MTARPRQDRTTQTVQVVCVRERESTFRYGSAVIISIAKTTSNGLPLPACLHVPMRVSHHEEEEVEREREQRTCWAPAVTTTISRQEKLFFFFGRAFCGTPQKECQKCFWAFSISYRPLPAFHPRSALLTAALPLSCNLNFYCFILFIVWPLQGGPGSCYHIT